MLARYSCTTELWWWLTRRLSSVWQPTMATSVLAADICSMCLSRYAMPIDISYLDVSILNVVKALF